MHTVALSTGPMGSRVRSHAPTNGIDQEEPVLEDA